jgi:hypothetical protein
MVTEEKKNEKTVRDFSDFRRNAHGCIFPYKETILGNDGKALVTTTYSEFETNFKADKNMFNYNG